MNYTDRWEAGLRTLRFVKGEVALVNRAVDLYFGTPCTVIEVGPFRCSECRGMHDYVIRLCDGKNVVCDDPDLKKFQPPADEKDESEMIDENNEVTV